MSRELASRPPRVARDIRQSLSRAERRYLLPLACLAYFSILESFIAGPQTRAHCRRKKSDRRRMLFQSPAQKMHTIRQSMPSQPFLSHRESMHMKPQIMEPETAVELVPQILHPKRILVPIDFSATSKKALQYALRFAEQFGCEIVLLHVVEPVEAIAGTPLAVDIFAQPEEDATAAEAELAC